MRFDVITIFPQWFESPLKVGLLGKAIDGGLVEVAVHDLRDWAQGPHAKVDDQPFGGGPGMVMMAEPVVRAVEAVARPGARVILLSASGHPLTQPAAAGLAASSQVVLVCGRYEGMDDRIRQVLDAEELSIGEFVVSGGEVGAMTVIEAVSRLAPGHMGNEQSLSEESFSPGASGLLEYPQYTRPAEFRGLKVPEILLSGDHGKIIQWRKEQSILRTRQRRPGLLREHPGPGPHN